MGSAIIGGIYAIGFGSGAAVSWIVLAGTLGNLADSVLGATLERSNFLNNNQVNFINTAIGALASLLFYMV